MNQYSWSNFYIATVADWHLAEIPDRPPDYISFTGSTYWDFGDRVRRWSDHWGKNIASCYWYLEYHTISGVSLCGECYYENFRSIRCLEAE